MVIYQAIKRKLFHKRIVIMHYCMNVTELLAEFSLQVCTLFNPSLAEDKNNDETRVPHFVLGKAPIFNYYIYKEPPRLADFLFLFFFSVVLA